MDMLLFLISNLRSIIGAIGVLVLIFGVINAFFGYRLFKMILSIIGFLVGAYVGLLLFVRNGTGDSDALIAWMLIGGFIGSTLAEILHKLGVFFSIGATSAITAFIITQNHLISLVIGFICGIAGVFLEKYVIIVTTALSGGVYAATGIALVSISNGNDARGQVQGWIIGICGMAFQLWLESRIEAFAGKEKDIKDKKVAGKYRFCSECGVKQPSNAAFCSNCGKSFKVY